jgi:hypothetical protein
MKNNLIWFTGAPGSKWSGTANVLQAIASLNFNITDRSASREYKHVGKTELARGIMHTGAYFGPGHSIGEDWDQLSKLSPSAIEEQILKEWSDPSYGNLLVKSHFLSHQLDFVAEYWPDNPIIMVFRPNESCEQGWFGAGGWNISYPNYRPYYKDDATMKAMIAEHNSCMKAFCVQHNIIEHKFNAEFLKEQFNWTSDMILDPVHRAWVEKHLIHINTMEDVTIAIYNQINL